MIRITGLRVRLDGVEALRLDELVIRPGEKVGVRGPNGSGKTTLLRVLAGFVRPSEGTVAGVPRPGATVLVHQQPYLFRGSARDNVAFALRLKRRPAREAQEWLARVGAADYADRPASMLSEGERRRVALARALAAAPELLLLDEPYAALDEQGCVAVTAALAAFPGTLLVAAPDLHGAPVDRVIDLG